MTPLLEARGITKEFSGVVALKNVDLTVVPGEILGLVGENGSGKSTLSKILCGVYPENTFKGTVTMNGRPCSFLNTRDARSRGIAMIHQELSVFPDMSVADNLFLTTEPLLPFGGGIINRFEKLRRARDVLARFDLHIDPRLPMKDFSVGIQQMIEILKAAALNAKLLILDEPTSALTDKEVNILYELLRQLKEQGVAQIYISHRMDEIFKLTDRITVLRDGDLVGTFETSHTKPEQIITSMVGRKLENIYPPKRQAPTSPKGDRPLLHVRDLSGTSSRTGRQQVSSATLQVNAGEIIGIAGLMGSGRSELLHLIFGSYQGERYGHLEIDGLPTKIRSPQDAIRHGIAFLTEDRKASGLMLDATIADNMLLVGLKQLQKFLLLNQHQGLAHVKSYKEKLKIKMTSPLLPVKSLSGGNQQKVLLAKWLLTSPRILLLDEPTRGIDVGAKMEIYHLIDQLARAGMAILMASSEMPEVIGMSDRVYVMHEGRMVEELQGARISQNDIMKAAVGASISTPMNAIPIPQQQPWTTHTSL